MFRQPSPNIRQKYLCYTSCCNFLISQAHCRGELWRSNSTSAVKMESGWFLYSKGSFTMHTRNTKRICNWNLSNRESLSRKYLCNWQADLLNKFSTFMHGGISVLYSLCGSRILTCGKRAIRAEKSSRFHFEYVNNG